MVYLIGGPPRCGKSSLAKLLLKRNSIPYLSTDLIVHMLKKAAPGVGITDKRDMFEKANNFYPFLEQLVKLARYDENNYVIEGDAITPEQADKVGKIYPVKPVFLGLKTTTLENVMKHMGSNDWMSSKSTEEQEEIVKYLIEKSGEIEKECRKYGMEYFDLSSDFQGKLEKAYSFLTG